MRKFILLFLFLFSSNLYAAWSTIYSSSSQISVLECSQGLDVNARVLFNGFQYVCQRSPLDDPDICPDGGVWDNENQICSSDDSCPEGQHLASIDGGTPFCTTLDCNGVGVSVGRSYGVGGICTEEFTVDEDVVPCDNNGSSVCFDTDNNVVPDTFQPQSDSPLSTAPVTPETNTNTTTDTVVDGDNQVKTDKTKTTNGDVTTDTTTTTTTNNVTGDKTTTTVETRTNNETGESTTKVTGTSSEGDGPPEENENTASGGQTCDVSPSCDGDAIQCAQLNQIWRLRCEDSNKEISSLDQCSGSFTCEGDAIQCARARLERDNYCSFDALKDKTAASQFEEDGFKSSDEYEDGSIWEGRTENIDDQVTGLVSDIAGAGRGAAGSCPEPFRFQSELMDFEITWEFLCKYVDIIRYIILFFAYFISFEGLVKVLRGQS